MGKTILIRALVSFTAIMALTCHSISVKADPGRVIVEGDAWLKDSANGVSTTRYPNGVPVCDVNNGGNTCGGQQAIVSGVSQFWQCVELAQRLYKHKGWDTAKIPSSGGFPNVPCAKDIYTQAQNLGFVSYRNGSISIADVKPGDMIVHTQADGGTSTTCPNGAGHVAIVDTVIGSTIYAKEQNWSPSGRSPSGISSYDWQGGTISRTAPNSRASSYIQGIVHSPLNVGNRMAVTQADFNKWCASGGADGASLIAPNAYSWACYKGRSFTYQPAINMATYCQSRYPGLKYVDILIDYNDPYSWRCYGPSDDLGALGQVQLDKYCQNKKLTTIAYSSAALTGKTVNDWYCKTPDGNTSHIDTFPRN